MPPACGPMVSPSAPRPVATMSPATPATGPSRGRSSGPAGRKPTRVSRYVAGPRPGATAAARQRGVAGPDHGSVAARGPDQGIPDPAPVHPGRARDVDRGHSRPQRREQAPRPGAGEDPDVSHLGVPGVPGAEPRLLLSQP